MRILITGATGFVGTHLRAYLLQHTDYELFGTSYPDEPPAPLDAQRESLHRLNLCDAAQVDDLISICYPERIIHLAAQSHVPTAYQDPWGTLENNIRGQLNLLEACAKLKLESRILVIGSGEEYGRAPLEALPLTEEHPLRPENPYSVSKVAQDVMGYQYFISHGLPVIRMRPFNHIGPGQSRRFVLPAFASQVAEIEAGQRPAPLRVGNLETARDFTDVRDVVRAYHLALEHGTPGEVYNVASGVARTIASLVERLRALARIDIPIEVDPELYRPADVPVIYGSAAKLKRATGWRPEISFEQTVSDVLAEWRQRLGI